MRKLNSPAAKHAGALTRGGTVIAIALALTTIAITPAKTFAQSGSVAGVVVGTGGRPVQSATVLVPGGAQRAITDSLGHFNLTGLSGSVVSIETRRLGYQVDRRQVRV